MTREAALGFDIGTTSVKAGLLWLDGDAPMTVVSRPYPSSRPQPGWVEQDPADWLRAMAACWGELQAAAGPMALRAVGICSQVNTHLLVDADLSPLRPAITWQDTRAASEAAALDADAEPRRIELWGGPFTVDASFSLSRLLWLSRHEPERRNTARWMLQPKDYCIAALTGVVVTDAISPIGLVGSGQKYVAGVLELVAGADRLQPDIEAFDAPAGLIVEDNPVGLPAGVAVSVGTMDAWASIYGAGLVRPGRAMDVAGTSEILAMASDRAVPTRGVISFLPVRGNYVHAAPTQAGGAALDWVAGCFSLTVPRALALAGEAWRDPRPIVFLPHLAGERAPHWNPDARGVFLGMTTSTELQHLVLAVLEGVAFAVRLNIGVCETAAGREADEIRICGGGARSPLWNRIKASTLGRPVHVLETLDAGVLGATLMGMVAAGLEDDLEALAHRSARVGSPVEPAPREQARLDDLYGVYNDAYTALEPLFPRISAGRIRGA
jgi:xylulokinase